MHYCQRVVAVGQEMTTYFLVRRNLFSQVIKSAKRSNFQSFRRNSEFWKRWNSTDLVFSSERRLSTFPLLTHSAKNVEFYGTRRNFYSNWSGFRVSEEVRMGVKREEAVVALESAIITHGMPFPDNIETALRLQNIIREQGAIPATVGVVQGQLTVGLSDEEIESLGTASAEAAFTSGESPVVKVSRRDLPFALSQKLNGGTTVSGTIVGAVKAGIHIFATGGIGGVHRGAETSFDISADLRELGRNPIAVVSAGVKSILDIGKTLEYLETEGVCVAVLKKAKWETTETEEALERNNDQDGDAYADDQNEQKQNGETMSKSGQIGRVKFPSFFTAESQFTAPYSLTDELQAAHLVNSSINFQLNSGILIAVPIPKEHEAGGQRIEDAVATALEKAEKLGVQGKDMTPFLLSEINRLTSGSSLSANKCLIENNVRVATQIAIFLAKLRGTGSVHSSSATKGGNRRSYVKPDGVGIVGSENAPGPSPTSPEGNSNMSNEKIVFVSHENHSQEYHQRFIDSGNKPPTTFPVNLEMSIANSESDVRKKSSAFTQLCERPLTRRPVVIGGSSMDLILSVEEEEIVSDGRTHRTKIRTAAGGVGRNVAEALAKLGHDPIFISAIGDDLFGRELLRHLNQNQMDTRKLFMMSETSTAVYSALLNHHGECLFGLGDMDIHSKLSGEVINDKCGEVIRQASIVVLDGNLTVDAITAVMSICTRYNVPVWFEPTELRKAKKILQVPREFWPGLRYLSPNLRELVSITEIDRNTDLSTGLQSIGTNNIPFTFDLSQLHSLYSRCFSLFVGLELILFTKGKDGIQIIFRGESDNRSGSFGPEIISHPAPDLKDYEIKSVSGAGDCLNAGFISGILHGMSLPECAIKGTFCAKRSLQSIYNVPEQFYDRN